MQIKDITDYLETIAPASYQEHYDNSGLILGSSQTEVKGIIITLDVTEDVIDEAIAQGDNLIIAHHPLIFSGLKRLNGHHWVDRCVLKAIKNDIAIYAIHTNLDNVKQGVNQRIAERIGLKNLQILAPKSNLLSKLTTFIPIDQKDTVLNSLFDAGAGSIGAYDHCSFQTEGKGTFRPGIDANPYIGSQLHDEEVTETRIEVIFPNHLTGKILTALKNSHPYEEVAYYLTPLNNSFQDVGSGMIGQLETEMEIMDFLKMVKEKMKTSCIRHTSINKQKVSKIAVCGGSGSFLLSKAKQQGAEVFITADFKYHDFFEAENDIIVADIGHYESEQFTKDLLYDILSKKFANIALRLTKVQTNPIYYL